MLVFQSKYEGVLKRAIRAEAHLYALQDQWNKLVLRVNAKGGESFLSKAVIRPVPQFTEDELAKLVLLCHPDKHDGKPMATEMTQKLLAIKRNFTKELS